MPAESASVEAAAQRRRLTGVAYRLLGSLSEAEDAVQEALARWYALPDDQRQGIHAPGAWLTTVVSRICLDMLGSARARRERYVGPWLPEPLPDDAMDRALLSEPGEAGADPLERVSLEESVSMALLAVLERLGPTERVALVLHDVLGYPFAEIAPIVGRSPGACRQAASTARRRVRAEARTRVSPDDLVRTVGAFKRAWEAGDVAGLISQLDAAAVATIDGGGKVSAAPAPLVGAEPIARFFVDVHRRQPDLAVREAVISGAPGLVARDASGRVLATVSLAGRGRRITDLWVVRNPDKLTRWRG